MLRAGSTLFFNEVFTIEVHVFKGKNTGEVRIKKLTFSFGVDMMIVGYCRYSSILGDINGDNLG